MPNWLSDNWFNILQSVGIIGSLLFTAVTLRTDARARRINNQIVTTEHHRDLLTQIYRNPNLARVLDDKANIDETPVTDEEKRIVALLILHFSTVYNAMRNRMLSKPHGLEKDIRWFFSIPISKSVWEGVKQFHDVDFVNYVEMCKIQTPTIK